MKKYLLAIGLVAFLMTSCCDKKEEKATCEHNCKDKKEQCDKHHHECDHHGEMPGMCPEMMGCMDAMVNALANWNDLDEDQRSEAIEVAKKMVEMKANMPKPDCCKEGKHEGCKKHEGECKEHKGECKEHKGECKKHEGCKHEEGKKCEGNHEGCQHQHEGCQHNK